MNKCKKGDKFTTREGYEVVITSYSDSSRVIAEFTDSGHKVYVGMQQLRNGTIKNPYHKSIHGVGYLGVGKYKASTSQKTAYWHRVWSSMISRCYDEWSLIKHPSYREISVSDEFLCFQNFAKWAESENLRKGMDVDKDLKTQVLSVIPRKLV